MFRDIVGNGGRTSRYAVFPVRSNNVLVELCTVRDIAERAFGSVPNENWQLSDAPPRVVPRIIIRNKELEQSHICLGTSSYQQDHEDRMNFIPVIVGIAAAAGVLLVAAGIRGA